MTATRVMRLDQSLGNGPQVRDVAAALLGGAVAAYPTETFYALGAAAFSGKAVDRVFRMKGRDASKPLSFIVSDMDMIGEISSSLPPAFKALAAEFWPGPLTLVLPAAAGLPERLLGPGRTIAVRIPPLAWLRAVVRELCEPLTATSANLAGEKELAEPAGVIALFDGKVDLIVDGGPAPGGLPSTIVDLTAPSPRILRQGRIPAARIEAFLRG
ncbi:MAG: L-threonylcarbamoyladenylate synthase [Candidatus Aminicenantes bacterium]|nr:L-threonylcarbamoyladenylate synthase [Candidatus Aminicenantes bacterium]